MNLANPALCGYKGDNKESRGIALQSQSTWIREMGNANQIGDMRGIA